MPSEGLASQVSQVAMCALPASTCSDPCQSLPDATRYPSVHSGQGWCYLSLPAGLSVESGQFQKDQCNPGRHRAAPASSAKVGPLMLMIVRGKRRAGEGQPVARKGTWLASSVYGVFEVFLFSFSYLCGLIKIPGIT